MSDTWVHVLIFTKSDVLKELWWFGTNRDINDRGENVDERGEISYKLGLGI